MTCGFDSFSAILTNSTHKRTFTDTGLTQMQTYFKEGQAF